MLNNPQGWSARYAAAKDRMANQEANAAKNAVRHAHRQEVEAKSDLAAKKISEAEFEIRMAQICADLQAVAPSGFHDESEDELLAKEEADAIEAEKTAATEPEPAPAKVLDAKVKSGPKGKPFTKK